MSQNYKKYAEYYKRYLSEKNTFDRAQRDIVTLHLKIDNLQKHLREICEVSLKTLEEISKEHDAADIKSIASAKLLGKIEELNHVPLGLDFKERV